MRRRLRSRARGRAGCARCRCSCGRAERLAQRELEHLLRARRERDLAGRDLVTLADDARDLGADLLDRDVEGLEHARGEAFLFAQQAEQDVLRADVVVLERPSLVLRENDDLPGPFGESFEQTRPFLAGRLIVAQPAEAMPCPFTESLRPLWPGSSTSYRCGFEAAESPAALAGGPGGFNMGQGHAALAILCVVPGFSLVSLPGGPSRQPPRAFGAADKPRVVNRVSRREAPSRASPRVALYLVETSSHSIQRISLTVSARLTRVSHTMVAAARLHVSDSPANDAPFRLIDDVEFGEDVTVWSFTNLYGCRIGTHPHRILRGGPARGVDRRGLQDLEPLVHLRRR